MKKISILITIIFVLFFIEKLNAQENCRINLQKAQDLYHKGNLEEIPGLLSNCLSQLNEKKDRSDAYKLLTKVYIFEQKEDSANLMLTRFLQLNPDYKLDTINDPAEFGYLLKNFRTYPLYTFGVFLRRDYLQISPEDINQTDSPEYISSVYHNAKGFAGGVQLNRFINRKSILSIELSCATKKYNLNVISHDFSSLDIFERQILFQLPIAFFYDVYNYKRYTAFLGAGINTEYNYQVTMQLVRKYNANDEGMLRDVTGADINIIQKRRLINNAISLGSGLKYQYGKGFLFAEIRYSYGLFNQVKNHYTQSDINFTYRYEENNFKINVLSLTLGYQFAFYHPEKLD